MEMGDIIISKYKFILKNKFFHEWSPNLYEIKSFTLVEDAEGLQALGQ